MFKYVVIIFILIIGEIKSQVILYDSLYNAGRIAYQNHDYLTAKRDLKKVLRFEVSKDSTAMNLRGGRSGSTLYSSKKEAFEILKDIYYSQGDYLNDLSINDSLLLYLHSLDPEFGDTIEIISNAARNSKHDIFASWCYYRLIDYDNSIKFSLKSINALFLNRDESYEILILAEKEKLGEERFKKIFIASCNSIVPLSDFPSINLKGDLFLNQHIPVRLNLLNHDIIFLIEDNDNIQKDLFDNKISYDHALKKIRIAFKQESLYKLIVEN